MRRPAPRPLRTVLETVTRQAAPGGALARVQASWRDVAGARVAEEAEPVAERDGTVTVRCRSAVWAQELELLSGDLVERLNEALGGAGEVRSLRFQVGSPDAPRRGSRTVL